MLNLVKIVLYILTTLCVFGVAAPALISARSYEAVALGGVLMLS